MDQSLLIEVNEEDLPATHNTELNYSCKPDFIKTIETVVVCKSGEINFAEESVSPCSRLGKFHPVLDLVSFTLF